MKIRYILLLATALVCSSIVFNNMDRLFATGSMLILMSRISLAILDVALIMYFFKRQRSAEVSYSTQLLNLIASALVIIVCIMQAIVS